MGDSYNIGVDNLGHQGLITDNVGKPKFELTEDMIREVVHNVPRGKPIVVRVIGSKRGFAMQDRLIFALRMAGLVASGDSAMMSNAGARQPFSIVLGEEQTTIYIKAAL